MALIPAGVSAPHLPLVLCRHHEADRSSPLALGYTVCEHAEASPHNALTMIVAQPREADPERRRSGLVGLITCPACTESRHVEGPITICAHDARDLFGVG